MSFAQLLQLSEKTTKNIRKTIWETNIFSQVSKLIISKHDKSFYLGFRISANIDLRQKWIAAIKRKNWTLSDKTFICSEHFKLTDYLVLPGNSRPKLKPDDVPSKFDSSSHICKPSPKKRLSRNSIASSSNVNINVTEVHKHDDSRDKIVQADLSKNSPRKRKLRRKIKTIQHQKRRQKVKIGRINSIIKTLKNRKFLSKKNPLKVWLSNFLVHPKLLLKMKSKITN